jgi:hypothetical protein
MRREPQSNGRYYVSIGIGLTLLTSAAILETDFFQQDFSLQKGTLRGYIGIVLGIIGSAFFLYGCLNLIHNYCCAPQLSSNRQSLLGSKAELKGSDVRMKNTRIMDDPHSTLHGDTYDNRYTIVGDERNMNETLPQQQDNNDSSGSSFDDILQASAPHDFEKLHIVEKTTPSPVGDQSGQSILSIIESHTKAEQRDSEQADNRMSL